jgi:hypothetical protein
LSTKDYLDGSALRVALACFVVAASACGGDRGSDEGPSAPSRGASTSATVVTTPPSSARRPPAPRRTGIAANALRVTAIDPATAGAGAAPSDAAEGGPLAVGDTLLPGRAVESGERSLILDFERGGRIEVDPGARFARSDASPMGVVLGEGGLHAVLPPGGGSARPSLRIATPSGTVEIAGSGELFVRVLPDGTAWVAQLAGLADVFPGGLADGRVVVRRLTAGRSLVVGQSAGAPVGGPKSLAAARTAAARLVRGAHRPSADALAARKEAARSAVTDAVRGFDEELGRGHELRRQHREAVAERSPNAMEIQSQVVVHSQAMLRVRQSALIAWEKASAISLHAGDGGALLEPLRQGAGRVMPSLREY